jgi:hypothetical protein
MKSTVKFSALLAIAAMFIFATAAFGQTTTVNLGSSLGLMAFFAPPAHHYSRPGWGGGGGGNGGGGNGGGCQQGGNGGWGNDGWGGGGNGGNCVPEGGNSLAYLSLAGLCFASAAAFRLRRRTTIQFGS